MGGNSSLLFIIKAKKLQKLLKNIPGFKELNFHLVSMKSFLPSKPSSVVVKTF